MENVEEKRNMPESTPPPPTTVLKTKRRILRNKCGPQDPGSETVVLAIYGPKWILPNPIKDIQASSSQTWLQVLQDTLQIELRPLDADSLMVRTRYYRAGQYGHATNLRSKICDFTERFCYKKKVYSVLLCTNTQNEHLVRNPVLARQPRRCSTKYSGKRTTPQSSGAFSKGLSSVADAVQKSERDSRESMLPPPPILTPGFPIRFPSTLEMEEVEQQEENMDMGDDDKEAVFADDNIDTNNNTVSMVIQANSARANKGTGTGLREGLEVNGYGLPEQQRLQVVNRWLDNNDEDAAASILDTSTIWERENGDEVEDLKNLVEQRMESISNDFLLQARKQYRELKATGKWEKVVARFPLGGYVFMVLFKE